MHDLLGILETLRKIGVVSNQFIIEVERQAFSRLVHISDIAIVGSKKYFSLIVEDDLNRLVVQTEKDCVLGANPLLNEDKLTIAVVNSLHAIVATPLLFLPNQVVFEVFEQSHFLL